MPWFPGMGGLGLSPSTQYGYGGRPSEPNTGFPKLGSVEDKNDEETNNSFNALFIRVEPKVKWFKPPLSIKIWKWDISFMWAYKVQQACELKNCVPIGIDDNDSKEVEISFSCNKFSNDKIDKAANKILENINKNKGE